MLRRTSIFVVTLVALGIVSAAARAAGEPPKGKSGTQAVKETAKTATWELSDSWITLKTKLALLADERVSSREVSGTTRQGVITLHGRVGSEEARQAAEEVALKIKGAQKVHNQLVVVSQAAREVVDRKDDQIVRDVEKRIKGDPRLEQADIEIRSDNGIVTLTGKAPSLPTSVRASEVASQVPGVRAVRNELSLEQKG
ncbi:MAG TPA: BON domain-containing protein [Candidatus Methylomirabilis sp.]